MYTKDIAYDRETRDYAMYLDKELVGFARTYHEAEVTLDQLVFELISGQCFASPDPTNDDLTHSATELDGGTPEVMEQLTAIPDGNDTPVGDDLPIDELPELPNMRCSTCNDSGLIPSNGCGDACGGWAEHRPDCDGQRIAREVHRDYHRFVRRIASLDEHALTQRASAYTQYLNARLPKQREPIDAQHIVFVWRLAVAKHGVRP